jgi:hypothetical protein
METLDDKTIAELMELSKQDFHCDNLMCVEYEAYHQCFNHSHVLCPQYEEYYQRRQMHENRNI